MADAVTVTATEAGAIIDDEALAEEDLLDELENGELPAHIREARLDQFKKQAHQLGHLKESGHGQYNDVKTEKELLAITTSVEKCVVHFYHSDFKRCLIMDTHLEKLSEKYFGTKFVKINVDSAPFLVKRLNVRVLPLLLCILKEDVKDRITGFDTLGNSDNFPTSVLEKRLSLSGVIPGDDIESDDEVEVKKDKKTIFGTLKKEDSDDEDDDDY